MKIKKCANCRGSGYDRHGFECEDCDGTGTFVEERSFGPDYFDEWDGVQHPDTPSLEDTHELAEWYRLGPSGY